jgi:hypothetical protein
MANFWVLRFVLLFGYWGVVDGVGDYNWFKGIYKCMDQKHGAKIEWKLTWHCCICCYPAKREDGP